MAKATSRGRRGLNRSDLLEGAYAMAAEKGHDGFSLRELGNALGVDPMTLLHHFGSKEGLLRAIADHALKTVDVPEPSDDWRGDVRRVARAYRALAQRHPRLFPLHFRYHATGARDHAASEVVHRALRAAGLADEVAAGQGLAFFAFVLGFALAEVEGLMGPLSAGEEAELLALDPEAFAATRAFIPAFAALDPDRVFSQSVEAWIGGIDHLCCSAVINQKADG
jgi:AcrR family transcriptional regulator